MNEHIENVRNQQGMAGNVGGLVHDVVTLVELQAELLKLDARKSVARIVTGVVLFGTAAAIAIGGLVVLLAGLAWLLVDAAELPRAAAFAIAAAVGVIAAALCGWLGWRQLANSTSSFARSRDEFAQNVRWLKQALKGRHERWPAAPAERAAGEAAATYRADE